MGLLIYARCHPPCLALFVEFLLPPVFHFIGEIGNPLRIITGKGNHSAGRVGVLKPALQSALTEDGWIVTTWDAGLVVRGARE